jgi:hypothetical protein
MKYAVLTGKPEVWCETQPVFFDSIKDAEDFIRRDSKGWMEGNSELELGSHDDWCEPYYILEVKKSFQPVVKISAKVSLKSLDKR